MLTFPFKSVCIESFGVHLPPFELTSAAIEDRLAPVYERLRIPFGTLERLSGISSRYLWPVGTMPSDLGTEACKRALGQIDFSPDLIQSVINCSVTRDYFEPATSALIHQKLGLQQNGMVYDISNACIGFSDGLLMTAQMIEAGIIKAGIVVTAETISAMYESTIKQVLESPDLTREQILKLLPTFTIGSGAVAFVLCHESISKNKHRFLGGIAKSATEHSALCVGNGDYELIQQFGSRPLMYTESNALITNAALLGKELWVDFREKFGWNKDDIERIICHQVGRQVNESFYNTIGLEYKKEFTIYKTYGNLVSAAMPTALVLSLQQKEPAVGDKILLTAYGSGLNGKFLGVEW